VNTNCPVYEDPGCAAGINTFSVISCDHRDTHELLFLCTKVIPGLPKLAGVAEVDQDAVIVFPVPTQSVPV
jgi:hypothetical protein